MGGIVTPYPTQKVSSGYAPPIAPEVTRVPKTTIIMKTEAGKVFQSVAINKSNLKGAEVMLSKPRKAEDSDGNEFIYYWVTFTQNGNDVIACTGEKFTTLLGKDADTDKLVEILGAHCESEFEIVHCQSEVDEETGEGGEYLFTEKANMPLLRIQKRANRKSLGW